MQDQHKYSAQTQPSALDEQVLNRKFEELQACLEEQIGQVSNELV